jgi:hypothetical protein
VSVVFECFLDFGNLLGPHPDFFNYGLLILLKEFVIVDLRHHSPLLVYFLIGILQFSLKYHTLFSILPYLLFHFEDGVRVRDLCEKLLELSNLFAVGVCNSLRVLDFTFFNFDLIGNIFGLLVSFLTNLGQLPLVCLLKGSF